MFIQNFCDHIDDGQCNEIFMLLNKKLASLLVSPVKSKDPEEEEDKENEDPMGNSMMGGTRGRSLKGAKNNKDIS